MVSPVWSMRYAALLRRLKRLAGIQTPPPPRPAAAQAAYDPSARASFLMRDAPLALSRAKNRDQGLSDWQTQARDKLAEITGYCRERPRLAVVHDAPYQTPGSPAMREVVLATECGLLAPLMIADPGDGAGLRPAMICLQGTNSGFHLSWGETREPVDAMRIERGGDFLRQAAGQGFVAVALEMRCFGRRAERALPRRSPVHSIDHALHLMLNGRSLLGERSSDVSLALDWLVENAPELGIDPEMIYIMGHSAGGSVALYSSALDTRIAGAILSGCIGYARETYGARGDQAGQNVVPGFLNWMETDDVLALCAPRPTVVISGTKDHIYPGDGASRVCASAADAWAALNASDRLAVLEPEGGHRFYPDAVWPAFSEVARLAPIGKNEFLKERASP